MAPRLAVLAAVLALLSPGTAAADPFDDVFADYQEDGRIDPCEHTPAELQAAKRDIPNDIDQYAPDFPAELDRAMEERARTDCDGAGAPGGAATTPAQTTTGAAPAPPPGSTTQNAPGQAPAPPSSAQPAGPANDGAIADAASRERDAGGDPPPPLIALAVAGGLLALCLLVWGLFRFFGWEPRWLLDARHAVAEAGWRTGGAWADFTDWLRSRRPAA